MTNLEIIGNVLWHAFVFGTGLIVGLVLEHVLDRSFRNSQEEKTRREYNYLAGRKVHKPYKRRL